MAKQNVNSIIVAPHEVYWLPENNFGRHISQVDNNAERNEKGCILASKKWDKNKVIEVVPFTKEKLVEVEARILAGLTALEGAHPDETYPTCGKTLSDAQEIAGYRALWFPNGKIRLPKYEGVFAFQRGTYGIYKAISLLISDIKDKVTAEKMEACVDELALPVRVMEYKNQAERIAACVLENTRMDTGRKSIEKNWPSLFQIAKDYYDASGGVATQSDINELLAGGTVKDNNDGIKVHSLLVLDCRFPSLGIADLLLKGKDILDKNGKVIGNEGLDFGNKMDRTVVWKFAQWLSEKKVNEDKTKRDAGKGNWDKLPPIAITTEKAVAEYLADPKMFSGAPKVSPVPESTRQSKQDTTANMFAKFVFWVMADVERLPYLTKLEDKETLLECNALAEKMGLAKDGQIVK